MAAVNRMEQAQAKLPPEYVVDADGVYYTQQSGQFGQTQVIRISHQPFWVEGRLVDRENSEQWSVLIRFYNGLGQLREATISYASLYSDLNSVFADLANQGLCFATSKASRDQAVTLLMESQKDAPISIVSHFGFDKATGCFVLPNNILVPKWHTGPVPRLNADLSKHHDVIRGQGSLTGWQDTMGAMASPLNILMLSTGLSTVFFNIIDIEPFGLHVYGASSSGKTNGLRACASLWGNSASHGKTYIGKWGATTNGLELACAARSGLPLTLDEIRQFQGSFESVAYLILDGVGKTRMRGNLQQAEQWKWRVALISTGELSSADITRKSGGDIFTGAQIRLLDLPIEGLSQRSSISFTAEEADVFRTKLGDNFGVAGPAFVRALQDEFQSFEELTEEMQTWFVETKQELKEKFPDNPAIQRVLPRFALVLMTGVLAVQTGIFPFSEEEITSAVHISIEAWLEAFEAPSDVERAIQDLRAALISNAHRIIALDEADSSYVKPIAYRDEKYIYLTDEHIKEVVSHVPAQMIAQQLRGTGVLHTNEKGRLRIKKNVPGLTEMRVFALKKDIFIGDLADSPSHFGDTGNDEACCHSQELVSELDTDIPEDLI